MDLQTIKHSNMSALKNAVVLLVEDNAGDVWLTKEAFSQVNDDITIDVVVDGEEAIKYLERQAPYQAKKRPDIVLLDLNLPKWSGLKVLERVKKNVALLEIPIIILSTSNAEHDILNAYKHQANCFITKPIDYLTFFKIIKKINHFWLERGQS